MAPPLGNPGSATALEKNQIANRALTSQETKSLQLRALKWPECNGHEKNKETGVGGSLESAEWLKLRDSNIVEKGP